MILYQFRFSFVFPMSNTSVNSSVCVMAKNDFERHCPQKMKLSRKITDTIH